MILTTALFLLQSTTNNVHFIGRFLKVDGGYACEWPGSALSFYAQGTQTTVHFKPTSENDRWQVDIDGSPTGVLRLKPSQDSYTIDLPRDQKRYLVTLVRRTECFSGMTTFSGVENGKLPSPKSNNRKIEIIGDSISAGYGVDGKTKEEKYSYDTANAYMTYGWIAARDLKAECSIIAWSGRKMWPDNTIPSIFDYALPAAQKGESATLDDPKTNAVLINLATNDFGPGIPDKDKWCGSYADFVRKVRSRFPKAHIYLATGSMMTDTWPPEKKHLTTLKGYLDFIVTQVGDAKVHRIDFAPQDEALDGIGSSWHPNAKTQTKMAHVLEAALRHDLGWK